MNKYEKAYHVLYPIISVAHRFDDVATIIAAITLRRQDEEHSVLLDAVLPKVYMAYPVEADIRGSEHQLSPRQPLQYVYLPSRPRKNAAETV